MATNCSLVFPIASLKHLAAKMLGKIWIKFLEKWQYVINLRPCKALLETKQRVQLRSNKIKSVNSLGFFPLILVLLVACSFIKSRLTLCKPKDCNVQDSSVHGISQARILEGIAISLSRGAFHNSCHISCIAGGFFAAEPPGKPHTPRGGL